MQVASPRACTVTDLIHSGQYLSAPAGSAEITWRSSQERVWIQDMNSYLHSVSEVCVRACVCCLHTQRGNNTLVFVSSSAGAQFFSQSSKRCPDGNKQCLLHSCIYLKLKWCLEFSCSANKQAVILAEIVLVLLVVARHPATSRVYRGSSRSIQAGALLWGTGLHQNVRLPETAWTRRGTQSCSWKHIKPR